MRNINAWIEVFLLITKLVAYIIIGILVVFNFWLGNVIDNWEKEGYDFIRALAIATAVAAGTEIVLGFYSIPDVLKKYRNDDGI